jgi:glycerophosphoryl diester phosphodiesterase
LPRVLLVGSRDAAQTWLTDAGLDRLSAFAHGIGPNKALLTSSPDIARAARERELLVTPWTFRARSPGEGFESVDEEMRHFACELGVTALFTDNPDLFPRDGCT